MRDCDHAHAVRADCVQDAVRKPLQQETSQLAIGNRIRGRAFANLFDGRLDLTLECHGGALAAFAVPRGQLRASSSARGSSSTGSAIGRALSGEDSCACLSPRDCLYVAAGDIREPALGFLDPPRWRARRPRCQASGARAQRGLVQEAEGPRPAGVGRSTCGKRATTREAPHRICPVGYRWTAAGTNAVLHVVADLKIFMIPCC